jgi:hypothetical protein
MVGEPRNVGDTMFPPRTPFFQTNEEGAPGEPGFPRLEPRVSPQNETSPAAAPGDVSNEAALAGKREVVVVALRPSHVVGAFRRSGVRPACPAWRWPVTLVCRGLTIGALSEEVK